MTIAASGSGNVISPPNGTTIYATSNATNITTLQCDLFHPQNHSQRLLVDWTLNSPHQKINLASDSRFLIHGEPKSIGSDTYNNLLSILRFPPEFHAQNLTCVGSIRGKNASFPLSLFSKQTKIILKSLKYFERKNIQDLQHILY